MCLFWGERESIFHHTDPLDSKINNQETLLQRFWTPNLPLCANPHPRRSDRSSTPDLWNQLQGILSFPLTKAPSAFKLSLWKTFSTLENYADYLEGSDRYTVWSLFQEPKSTNAKNVIPAKCFTKFRSYEITTLNFCPKSKSAKEHKDTADLCTRKSI